MKKIKFTCSHCQAKLRVPTHLAGVTAPCPKCGHNITAPTDIENFVEETPRNPAVSKSPERKREGVREPALAVAAATVPQARVSTPQPQPVGLPVPAPTADTNYSSEEIIVESKSIAPPEPIAPVAPESRGAEPPPPLDEPSISDERTQPISAPQPPAPPVQRAIYSPPAPIPSNLPASIQHEVLPVSDENEETEEPPAVAKTQPIKINPRPSNLPQVRSIETAEPGELPRLDTSLAGNEQTGSPETLTPESGAPGHTKVMLPMPGESVDQITPGDFIVPSEHVETGLAELSEEIDDQEADAETTEPAMLEPPVSLEEPVLSEVIEPVIPTPIEPPVSGEMEDPLAGGIEASLARELDEMESLAATPEEAEAQAVAPISIDDLEPTGPIQLLEPSVDEVELTSEPEAAEKVVEEPNLEGAVDVTSDLGLDFAPLETESEEVATLPAPEMPESPTDDDEVEATPEDFDLTFDDDAAVLGTKEETPFDEPNLEAESEPEDSILDIFADTDEADEPAPSKASASLSDGSFGSLLSQQTSMTEGLADAGVEVPAPRKLVLPTKNEESATIKEDDFEGIGTSDLTPPSGGGDVLDDMFGPSLSTKSKKAPSRTAVVMISAVGAVAIISIVVVIFVVNVLGGFQVTPSEPEIQPPPPAIANEPEDSGNRNMMSPGEDSPEGDAPASIGNAEQAEEIPDPDLASAGVMPDTSIPEVPDTPTEPVELVGGGEAPPSVPTQDVPEQDAPALSFDERVRNIVNGTTPEGSSGIGTGVTPQSLNNTDLVGATVGQFGSDMVNAASDAAEEAASAVDNVVGVADSVVEESVEVAEEAVAGVIPSAQSAQRAGASGLNTYNPPASFAAPGPNDGPLGKTHDLLDAFLRAPDWETRVKYSYEGESLRPAMADYYLKWPFESIDKYSLQLFQIEENPELGGPYWMYLIAASEDDEGFPVIIRNEAGLLKLDWEIFAEFYDRHFVKFREGELPSPRNVRVVIERVSDYYGLDREGFKDLSDYYVYQINPPYGGLNEFSSYAFVKKESKLSSELEAVVGLGEEPLAVIVTLEEKIFAHGVEHLLITDYVAEGWFRE